MFKAAYDSVENHPGVAWLATLVFVVLLFRKRPAPFLFGALVVFACEISLDAFFTSPTLPARIEANKGLARGLEILFVILGDYRFFVLVERFTPKGAPPPTSLGPLSAWLRALAWAFVVPLSWAAIYLSKWVDMHDDTVIYLVYELLFMALAFVLRFVVLPLRLAKTAAPLQRYVLRLTTFELVQYTLWALADVLILGGTKEPGYLVRIVPNVTYYGAFLFFAWKAAPEALRGQAAPAPAVASAESGR